MNTFIDMTSLKGVQHRITRNMFSFDENKCKLRELQNDSLNYHRRAIFMI